MDDDQGGYLRAGSKLSGLWRTPSMAAPSWLFHDTTSSVLVVQFVVWLFMLVNFLVATYTSAIDFASARRYAIASPSFDSEKPEFTVWSVGEIFVTAFVLGSRRYR